MQTRAARPAAEWLTTHLRALNIDLQEGIQARVVFLIGSTLDPLAGPEAYP